MTERLWRNALTSLLGGGLLVVVCSGVTDLYPADREGEAPSAASPGQRTWGSGVARPAGRMPPASVEGATPAERVPYARAAVAGLPLTNALPLPDPADRQLDEIVDLISRRGWVAETGQPTGSILEDLVARYDARLKTADLEHDARVTRQLVDQLLEAAEMTLRPSDPMGAALLRSSRRALDRGQSGEAERLVRLMIEVYD